MEKAKRRLELLSLLLENDILTFGDFITKAGRKSPFFFNFGKLCRPRALNTLAGIIADSIVESGWSSKINALFGPAYKGISLSVASSLSLAEHYGVDVPFCFNRKETKTHGEGGPLVGAALQAGDKVVVIDDVLTGGTSVRESLNILHQYQLEVIGIVIVVNRQEKGMGTHSAASELEKESGAPVVSLLNFDEIIDLAHNKEIAGRVWINNDRKRSIDEYRALYGSSF